MDAEEVTIVSVADQVAVKFPLPLDAVVGALSFETRAVEKIREPIGPVRDDCRAPPIRQRSRFIGIVKSEVAIAMKRLR